MQAFLGKAKTLKIEDSLWEKNPRAGHLWHKTLNGSVTPIDVGFKSNHKYFFHCENCQETFSVTLGNLSRTREVRCSRCRYAGVGRLNSRPRGRTVADNEELVGLWDQKRNMEDPATVSENSSRKFYWLCSAGHSTRTSVWNRYSGKSCSKCAEKRFVSKPEHQLRDFIRGFYDGALEFNKKDYSYPYELDIVLPELKMSFEFNGDYFHSEKFIFKKHGISAREYHERKRNLASSNAIRVFFVWENDWNNRPEETKQAIKCVISGHSPDEILGKMSL